MAQLEKLNYNRPQDFFTMMVFGAATLMVGYQILGLSTKFLGHNLSTFLVYIWARMFEGTDVNVMDLFLLKAEVACIAHCSTTATHASPPHQLTILSSPILAILTSCCRGSSAHRRSSWRGKCHSRIC